MSELSPSVLGADFLLDFGAFNVTDGRARIDCPLEHEVLVTCLGALCSNFTDVCPTGNGIVEGFQAPLTCDNVDTTICDTFGSINGCCMDSCALELQDLAICAGSLDLLCDDPTCSLPRNNSGLSCTREGDRYSCVHNFNIAPDGTVLKSVEATINCAYDLTLGSYMLESDCECESAILIGDSATQVCACGLCQANQTRLVSLDCSISVDDPFVVDKCRVQTCSGECMENGNLGDLNFGNGTDIPQSEAPTAAPTKVTPGPDPETTSPPSAGVMSPSEAPSSIPSAAASLTTTQIPSTLAGGQTATTGTPSTTAPSITGGGNATSTIVPSTPADASASSNPAQLETTLPPTIANTTNRTVAPTINNVSTSSPTAGGPTSKPTGWPAWGNITDRPLNNNTESPVDRFNMTDVATETTPPETKSSKWYTHNMVITFGGDWYLFPALHDGFMQGRYARRSWWGEKAGKRRS